MAASTANTPATTRNIVLLSLSSVAAFCLVCWPLQVLWAVLAYPLLSAIALLIACPEKVALHQQPPPPRNRDASRRPPLSKPRLVRRPRPLPAQPSRPQRVPAEALPSPRPQHVEPSQPPLPSPSAL